MDTSSFLTLDDEPPPEPRDGWLLVRIHIPDLNIYKCLQFPSDLLVWDVKQQVLSSLPKELKESFNYGLFCPPSNGKAGKFLDEERRLGEYPFNGPVGYLELKYKRRVYKMLSVDERQLKALHTRANLRRFLECINGGHVEKITKMCAKGLDPNFHCSESGETPLALATSCKKPNKLLIALVNGGALLDYRTKDGTTALHRAVEKDSIEAVTTLLELGASPNYKDMRGLTPLYISITKKCDSKITETLLHDHANLGTNDTQGWNEVHQACRHGLLQHLEHLLTYGADMDAQNASGNTPLHVCAVNNQESCAKLLLFRGAQRGALNFANQTPYQVAVIAGNLELAEMIQNYKMEDVVPLRRPPRYNPKRRSGINWINGSAQMSSTTANTINTTATGQLLNPITRHMFGVPHGPPSPCPSEHLPYSSASSSLSEGSSGHRLHEDDISFITDKSLGDGSDIVSDSSGVGTNSDSAACSIGHPSTSLVCIENYAGNKPGHIRLQQGDIIEVVGSTDCGLLEGYVRGTNNSGFFPAECVQEVNMRPKSNNITMSDIGSGMMISQGGYQTLSKGPAKMQGSPQLSIGGSSGIGGSTSGTLSRQHHQLSPSPSISNKGSNITLNGSAAIIGSPTDDQSLNENSTGHYSTATTPRLKKTKFNEPKTVVLHRAKRGFGFILRGAKASSQLMQLKPSERFPALQYLDDVDPGGVADMAGLKPGDFLLSINGTDVRSASHEKVVEMIRSAGALVSMTVISPQFPNQIQVTPQLISSQVSSSGPSTPQANHRQCATLPRKMSMGPVGAGGKMKAPAPPRRDPKTTLSVGRARAKSMVAGLENGGEKDENGSKQTKSSSVESIAAPTQTNPGTPVQLRTASIKARPTSNRITAAELEELFQRQQGESVDGGSKYATMMTTSNFQTGNESVCSSPPASNVSPIKGPLIYGSVAEMKRKTKSKNGTLRGKPVSVPSIGGTEMKRFHSTPDLMGNSNGSSSSLWNGVGKIHRSQDDVATLHTSIQRLNTLPPPAHPPPPPPVGQVVKVETRSNASEYESTISLQQKLKKRAENDAVTSAAIDGIQSSFNPSANAKIYASPQELRNVMSWKMRQSPEAQQNVQQMKPTNGNLNHNHTQNQHPNSEFTYALSETSQSNTYAQPITNKPSSGVVQGEQSPYVSNHNSQPMPPNMGPVHVTAVAPPIPDPDYSLSESDGEDENSILVARNTKLNEKIAFIENPESLVANVETPITSENTANGSNISHSLSVDEIQRVRNNLKTSKSSPNGFSKPKDLKSLEQKLAATKLVDEPDNAGAASPVVTTNVYNETDSCIYASMGMMKPTDTIKKKPSVTIIEKPTVSAEHDAAAVTVAAAAKKVNIKPETNQHEIIYKQSSQPAVVEAKPKAVNMADKVDKPAGTVTVKQMVQQQHAPIIHQQQVTETKTKTKTMVITSEQLNNKVQPNMAKKIQNSHLHMSVEGDRPITQTIKAAESTLKFGTLTKQQQMTAKGTNAGLKTVHMYDGGGEVELEQRSEDDGELSPSPPAKAFQRHNSLTRKQAAAIAVQRASRQSPSILLTQLPPPLEVESESESGFMSKGGMSILASEPSNPQVCPENIVLAPPPQFCDCNDIKHSSQIVQHPQYAPLHTQYAQQRQPQLVIIQQHSQQPMAQTQAAQTQSQIHAHTQIHPQTHYRSLQAQNMTMNMNSINPTDTLGRVRIINAMPKGHHHRNY